ncbi:MAG: B12-binding domain-containing radical SAM protein [Candidatus Bathyarchaeia archaeon]
MSRDYRSFPLLNFLPCAPVNVVPQFLCDYLAGSFIPSEAGRAERAPYGLRKIEAALLRDFGSVQVAVAHPDYIENFVDKDTKIIGVYTMDPKGLGPLTMTFTNGRTSVSIAENEFSNLMRRINHIKRLNGCNAKVVVGGPGTWEFWYAPEDIEELGIDYLFQGEAEDIIVDLFKQLSESSLDKSFTYGFQTFDEKFHKKLAYDEKQHFVTRTPFTKQFPTLDEIPAIQGASMQGLVEAMRGCGIGCDFCEVTLRPNRYSSPEKIIEEILVNRKYGINNAWLHSDEIFAYQHGLNFVPNEEALVELFTAVMSVVPNANPTHGRISIPAAYPELIEKLSKIFRAREHKQIGIQVGLETGSDELARKHMPNKTLPLKVGPDGSWPEIVRDGLVVFDKHHWEPAFTVQIGQSGETPDDNWMTVGMINDLSNHGLNFTVTPMINVPLGLLKTKGGFLNMYEKLDESQAAVIYSCFRHLAKMARRDAYPLSRGNFLSRIVMTSMLVGGSYLVQQGIRRALKRTGLDTYKTKNHTLNLFNN